MFSGTEFNNERKKIWYNHIKAWKRVPHYRAFVWGTRHWSPVDSPNKVPVLEIFNDESSYQYGDPHVKDKTVSTVLSLTWESPYLEWTVFILRRTLIANHLFTSHWSSGLTKHWNVYICLHFDEILITGCTGSCQMTTSSAANDENFVKMTTFSFQWSRTMHGVWCLISALIVLSINYNARKRTRKLKTSQIGQNVSRINTKIHGVHEAND